ncbi:SLATT domain-containing protein [Kribbella sp. NPDC051952]|uniref:SLATT domain-containing protein n=1 Tax=Kribbella sp. NPDC051952 TaxID=3154851 RepID=UPI00342C6894
MGYRDDLVWELKRLETDVLYSEKAHFASAEHYRVLHYVLGGFTAVASALATTTALKERSGLAASLALAAAFTAALLTFLKPQGIAERHRTTARQLGDLKFRIRQAHQLDGHPGSGRTDEDLRELIRLFTAEKQQIHADAQATGPFAFWRAQRKIDAGHFSYDKRSQKVAQRRPSTGLSLAHGAAVGS